MSKPLRIVTGAPGAEKSTVIEHLLEYSVSSKFVFLDIDLIADSASKLAKSSIYTDPSKRWTMPIRNWRQALNRFMIMFEDRLTEYM